MILATIIGAVAGAAAAGHFVTGTRTRLTQMAKTDTLAARTVQLSQSIRGRAKQSLTLRRRLAIQLDDLRQMEQRLGEEQDRLHQLVSTLVRTYVLDERKLPGDTGYLFTISHADFASVAPGAPPGLVDSWRQGRRCVVWAADPERATRRAALRCPPQRGYSFGPTIQPLPSSSP